MLTILNVISLTVVYHGITNDKITFYFNTSGQAVEDLYDGAVVTVVLLLCSRAVVHCSL